MSSTHDSGPITNGYYLVLFGQLLGAIGQPFSMNAPTKLASEWFSVAQRDVATTVAAMSNPVGIAIGQLLPSFFVTGDDTDASGISLLLLVEAGIASASLLLTFLFQAKPPTPPSRSQEQRERAHAAQKADPAGGGESSSQVWADVKALTGNRNFMILNAGFGIGIALFNGTRHSTPRHTLFASSSSRGKSIGQFFWLMLLLLCVGK